MHRLTSVACFVLLVPGLAAAAPQTRAPVPEPYLWAVPVAQVPPAPQVVVPAPVPAPPSVTPLPPVPPVSGVDAPRLVVPRAIQPIDSAAMRDLENQLKTLKDMKLDMPSIDVGDLNVQLDAVSAKLEALRDAGAVDYSSAIAQAGNDQARAAADQARAAAEQARQLNQLKVMADRGPNNGGYDAGLSALQQHRYDQAITDFDRVVAAKADRADGALYWKAFAEYKLANTEAALAAIASLRTDHPQSRYLTDAKVLEADVKKANGQPVNLDANAADEDIKILAIQGIQRSDPARAIPLLEGVLMASNSLQVKKQAIYVLALSQDPSAHQVLLKYAKGGGNPDLQAEAIRYLASRSDRQTTSADLKSIYESTQDDTVKRAIIDAYRISGDKSALMAIALQGGSPVIAGTPGPMVIAGRGPMMAAGPNGDIRVSAINALSSVAAPADLWTLFQEEPDPVLRAQIVGVLGSMGAIDQLTQAARTDKDASVRQRAIRTLGTTGDHAKTGPILIDLYAANADKDTREAIIGALASQDNADGLVALARKETSLDLKRDIVGRLSAMAPHSKAAADYMMDVLK